MSNPERSEERAFRRWYVDSYRKIAARRQAERGEQLPLFDLSFLSEAEQCEQISTKDSAGL